MFQQFGDLMARRSRAELIRRAHPATAEGKWILEIKKAGGYEVIKVMPN